MKILYGGIDLHANNSVVVVLDEEDQVVYRQRLPNSLEQFSCNWLPIALNCKDLWWSRHSIGIGWLMG